jgi:hypothetical protein
MIGTVASREKFARLMTMRPKKTFTAPIVLRIDQLNSKYTGSGVMMVDRVAPAPLGRLA